jgi:hypothetical protein
MSATPQSTRRKLSLLQLGEELGNVAKACKIMGYHRDTFYEVKRAFQIGGVAGLVEKKRGPRHPHPNRVPDEVEKKILTTRCGGRLMARNGLPTSSGSRARTSAPAASAVSGCATTWKRATSGSCGSSASLVRTPSC